MERAEWVTRAEPGMDGPPRTREEAPAQQGELAALRARLREVEVALGLPADRGQVAAAAPAALLRRIAALERHAGIVPGLTPLPGYRPATPAPPAPPAARPDRAGWPAVAQSLVAAALLVALVAWLTHPWPGPARLPTAAEPAPVATTAALAPAPAAIGTTSPGAMPPVPAPDCPLDTAGPCLGQWSSPLTAP